MHCYGNLEEQKSETNTSFSLDCLLTKVIFYKSFGELSKAEFLQVGIFLYSKYLPDEFY